MEAQARTLGIAVCCLSLTAFAVAACGGGSVGTSTLPGNAQTLQLKTPLASPTPTPHVDTASTTVPLAAGVPIALPQAGGVSGSFTESYASAPPGTTVTLTTYDRPPAGAPAIQGEAVPLAWIKSSYSGPVTLNGFPSSLTYTLPAGFNTANSGFEMETFDGNTGMLFGYDVSKLSGSTVALTDPAVVGVTPAHTYWWELICNGTNGLDVPLSTAGQTTKMLPMCGFDDTHVSLPSNNAVSGARVGFAINVPPCCAGLPSSPPPGTITGLMAIKITNNDSLVPQGVNYSAGSLAFDTLVPPVIPTQGKTFIAIGCSFKIVWTGGSNYQTGCLDTPYVSGPLSVAGQTLSFSGVPFPISLPPMSGTDCAGLNDCAWTGYAVSVFY